NTGALRCIIDFTVKLPVSVCPHYAQCSPQADRRWCCDGTSVPQTRITASGFTSHYFPLALPPFGAASHSGSMLWDV
ncbi:hypothetical protein BaRGS_00001916, partial [Batillaria attramentaria]